MQQDARPKGLRVVVIGAGMSGILCGIRLQQEGIEDFTIHEKAGSLGGTWRDNRYPGLTCDVPSHVYSYSFEPNPDWSRKYSAGSEIRDYLERVARKYRVMPFIRFGSEITACDYEDGRWRLTTADGHHDSADVVIAATGILHHPRLPDIPGRDSFAGADFHSARWPDGLSLAGKRVGVIGTGSTAIQIVGAIVDEVAALSLFQRTPQWIYPEPNRSYDEHERDRFRAEPDVLAGIRARMQRNLEERFSNALIDADSVGMRAIADMCWQHLENGVADPDLRARLTPDYQAGCKRLIVADGFYDAIQRHNARLVDRPIEAITPAGPRTADGEQHELDVLVYATGFDAHRFVRPINLTGRNGRTLDEAWARSVRAYRSTALPDFPNFFMIMGPQSPVGNFSLIDVAETQVEYILRLIAPLRRGEAAALAPRPEAMQRFNERAVAAMDGTIWVTGCGSWYLDEDGVPVTWPWTLETFRREMREPDFADYELAG